MRIRSAPFVAIVAGIAATSLAFFSSAGAEDKPATEAAKHMSSAVFAGGCFWCVESDFDKVEGVIETVSGYTGGHVANPTYKQVSHENTGHYESVKVTYDPDVVSYNQLVTYFLHSVDPTDADGQFCDKGESYRTAIFVSNPDERATAEADIATVEASGVLPAPIVTKVINADTFWPAEDYHQDYYTKNPLKYRYYRAACGRDGRVKELWGDQATTH
ncbi:MAG: peptide-methionine (S)-S-oxide reductase MsrA [Alphaproteobacteria bacterium]|nr:peptide-methionine (S)-S-oxide reductase MsrA [Alphaproteobacteria bacterium]